MEEFNGGGRIKSLLKIFNECRSLTGVGNLTLIEDLQWMEEFNGGGRIKPLLKNLQWM